MDAVCNVKVAEGNRNAETSRPSGIAGGRIECMLKLPTYALITPARNEAEFLELTLQSVIAQTVLPAKWVIVSDGSTDGTDDIVKRYAAEHPWIELVRMPERKERHFAGKVLAFDAGFARVKELGCDIIGCLDGDISFNPEYFEFLLGKMAEDPKLGLVGTRFRDPHNYTYDYRFVSIEHVTGCCQLFRRTCYQEIGGYVPAKGGAIDRIVNISARMRGWKTRTFTEQFYLHHREMGTANQGIVKVRFKDGAKDYAVGSHPLWEIFRSVYQMSQRPFIIGGFALLAGFFWQTVRGVERPVSREFIQFNRQEQMRRLKLFFAGRTLKSNA
jgi:glycosyltransferase involved in cell wall biosynthesis